MEMNSAVALIGPVYWGTRENEDLDLLRNRQLRIVRADRTKVLPGDYCTQEEGPMQNYIYVGKDKFFGHGLNPIMADRAKLGKLDNRKDYLSPAWFVDIIEKHAVFASTGGGGDIEPEGETLVRDGGDQVFTIRPAQGWRIKQVVLDGDIVNNPNAKVVCTGVTSDHFILVWFEGGQ